MAKDNKLIDEHPFEVLTILKVVGPLKIGQISKCSSVRTFILMPGIIRALESNGCITASTEGTYELTKHGIKVFYINNRHRENIVRQNEMRNNPQTLHFNVHPEYKNIDDEFRKHYTLVNVILPFESNKKSLKKKQDRVCRFCGLSERDVTFKNEAHLFPHLMGNKVFFSDFECDVCNQYFGNTLDNNLANYLGVSRTITKTKGKRGIPSFSSSGSDIEADIQQLLNEEMIVISRKDATSDTIKADATNGIIRAKFKRQPFTPIKVYRAILKVALSLLPADEMKNYRYCLDFLMSRTRFMTTGYVMNGYSLPYNFNLPVHALVFEKKDKLANISTHIVAIYFGNSIFAIPIPLHNADIPVYKKESAIRIYLYPPLFTQYTSLDGVELARFNEDFSSEEEIRGSEQEIICKISKGEQQNTSVFDSATGEFNNKPFNPSEIMGIYIRQSNGPIDPKALFDALKHQINLPKDLKEGD